MDWVKLGVRYYFDTAIRGLDGDLADAAEVMFTRGLARAGEVGCAGFIPEQDVELLTRRRRYGAVVQALVRSGLWAAVAGGYQVQRWSDWQDHLDALTRKRTADRDRQRRRRAAAKDGDHLSRDCHATVAAVEEEGEKEIGGVVQRPTGGDQLAHPPPKTCTKHPNGTDEPCRGCQSARLAHETWHAEKRQRIDSAPKCRNHRGQPADNCSVCASERKARRKDET